MLQQTLVVFKPDAVARNISGEIISRFEKAGLHIVAMKMVRPDKQFFHDHYEGIGKLLTRTNKEIFESVMNLMMESPVIAMVIEGVESVEFVRKMVGATEPKSAQPGTIRGDYAHISYGWADNSDTGYLPNLIHASATPEEAKGEIAHRFSQEEIFDHQPLHERFTR